MKPNNSSHYVLRIRPLANDGPPAIIRLRRVLKVLRRGWYCHTPGPGKRGTEAVSRDL